jgi:tRNA pseudouridine(55) synthase
LLCSAGDAVHQKDQYNKLDKVYRCTALLGVATDTYDVLGFPTEVTTLSDKENKSLSHSEKVSNENIQETPHKDSLIKITEEYQKVLDSFLGVFEQEYPPFSSKTVKGIALHERTRKGLSTLLPTREVTVYENNLEQVTTISTELLLKKIITIIDSVKGDFRQGETVDKWNAWGQQRAGSKHLLITFSLRVSSGTYIRGIVDNLGRELGCGACILDLERLQVGSWTLDQCEEV